MYSQRAQPASAHDYRRTNFDCTRLDKEVIPGGPISDSYETYVKSIFHPNQARGVGIAGVPPGGGAISSKSFLVGVGDVKQKINASIMLKMEENLGKDALNDECRQYEIGLLEDGGEIYHRTCSRRRSTGVAA